MASPEWVHMTKVCHICGLWQSISDSLLMWLKTERRRFLGEFSITQNAPSRTIFFQTSHMWRFSTFAAYIHPPVTTWVPDNKVWVGCLTSKFHSSCGCYDKLRQLAHVVPQICARTRTRTRTHKHTVKSSVIVYKCTNVTKWTNMSNL